MPEASNQEISDEEYMAQFLFDAKLLTGNLSRSELAGQYKRYGKLINAYIRGGNKELLLEVIRICPSFDWVRDDEIVSHRALTHIKETLERYLELIRYNDVKAQEEELQRYRHKIYKNSGYIYPTYCKDIADYEGYTIDPYAGLLYSPSNKTAEERNKTRKVY